jgi:hypothetical protein
MKLKAHEPQEQWGMSREESQIAPDVEMGYGRLQV